MNETQPSVEELVEEVERLRKALTEIETYAYDAFNHNLSGQSVAYTVAQMALNALNDEQSDRI